MSVLILLMKLKEKVLVCWFIALWEDPEGDIPFLVDPLKLECGLFIF